MQLTLDPELVDPAVDLDGLQGDAEHRQADDGDEEDLARVPLEEAAELAELVLQLGPDAHRRPLPVRLALQHTHTQRACVSQTFFASLLTRLINLHIIGMEQPLEARGSGLSDSPLLAGRAFPAN